MYLVTGATGNVGGELVAQLHAEGHAVRAYVRNPDKADFADAVEVAVGDLDDETALTAAARGAEGVFYMQVEPDPVQAELFVRAATAAGVRRIVLLSSIGTLLEPKPMIGAGIAARDDVFRRSGLHVTYLCPNTLQSNALWWIDTIRREGRVIDATYPGKTVPVDPHDIARIALLALTQEGHAGKTYILNGPEALSTQEQVEIVADVTGKPIALAAVSPAELEARSVGDGAAKETAAALRNLNELFAAGRAGIITHDIENLTGVAPRTFRQWCEAHVDELR